MICAYSEMYLDDAMTTLGEAFDYAVNTCGIEIDSFMRMFLASGLADYFAHGNPRYVCGMSGNDLAKLVIEKSGLSIETPDYEPEYNPSEEYWAGWILAYYQWFSAMPFRAVHGYISMAQVRRMYYPLHEAPESKFVDSVNSIISRKRNLSRLQTQRKLYGFSQSELARRAGVNLRTLQQYELRTKDINKASVTTVLSLCTVLGCPIESILEPQTVYELPR